MWYLCVSMPHLLPLILCTLLSYGTHHLLQREASLIIDALIYGCKGKNSGNCLILRFLSTVKVCFVKLHFIPRNLRLLKSLFIRKLFIKPMKQNNLVDNQSDEYKHISFNSHPDILNEAQYPFALLFSFNLIQQL